MGRHGAGGGSGRRLGVRATADRSARGLARERGTRRQRVRSRLRPRDRRMRALEQAPGACREAASASHPSPQRSASADLHRDETSLARGASQRGIELLEQLRGNGGTPELRSFNMLISGAARAGECDLALRLLDDTRDAVRLRSRRDLLARSAHDLGRIAPRVFGRQSSRTTPRSPHFRARHGGRRRGPCSGACATKGAIRA